MPLCLPLLFRTFRLAGMQAAQSTVSILRRANELPFTNTKHSIGHPSQAEITKTARSGNVGMAMDAIPTIVLNRQRLLVFRPYDRAQLHTLKGSNQNQRSSPSWPCPELLRPRCVVLPQAKLIGGL